jgi:3-methyladenine DNA glycosylase AlkD
MHKLDAQTIIAELQALGSSEKARTMERFFKTGPGHYGHGDIFWGISVPETRKVARKYAPLEADQLEILLEHSVHEVRQCALLIMVMQAKKFPKQAYALYLKKIDRVNNWDLVDVSAPAIVGDFLLDKDYTPL